MTEETLFHEALAKPPGERAAFLDAACASQPQLRASVEALLLAHEGSGGLLDHPLPMAPDETTPHLNEPLGKTVLTSEHCPALGAGIVIAERYILQEKIGEGGMGEVWVAKQTQPVKRKVALKVIKAGMDSRAVLQRFDQERQALALMDHPNIARVFDGGMTPTGQPFFIMELVNGLPLLKFCDQVRLTPRERLELFVPICQAVQHAHQKGIIHRDLKPANILVTLIDGRGVPKVIDFGVAKATAGKLIDESLSTQFGAVVGTLEYMSPEQAGFAGEDIDTRADIYSLGVILYELLTGLRPIDANHLKKAALPEMIRILRDEEPSKPSTRLSTNESLPTVAASRQIEPNKLMAMLRGELDWMVMKCLEKQRDRRYETANALARDVQRYLAGEVVEARPPSARYRLSKFLRRNKGPVLATGLVGLALVAGIVGTTYGLLRAEWRRVDAEQAQAEEAQQRAKAEARRVEAEKARDRTRQALDDMTSSVTGASLTRQKEITPEQKKFLTQVLTYYQEFAGEKADDESGRARTAAAAMRVGLIENRLGRMAEAVAAYRLARDSYERLIVDFPNVPTYKEGLATAHNNQGALWIGLGKLAEAELEYRKSVAIYQQLVADFPAVTDHRHELAGSLSNLGLVLKDLGKQVDAEQQYRKAIEIGEKLAADFPAVASYRQELAGSYINLGIQLSDLGKQTVAERQFRNAIALYEKLAADFPGVPEYQRDLANNLNNLGMLLASMGKRSEAEQLYRKALSPYEKLASDFPAVPQYRKELAGSHNLLGVLLKDLGKLPEAEQQHRKSVAMNKTLVADFPAVPDYRQELAGSHSNLGSVLDKLGKRPEAEEQYRKALTLLEKLSAELPAVPLCRQYLATTHNNLGLLLSEEKRLEAEQQYHKALTIQAKLASDFPGVSMYRQDLARTYQNLGNLLTSLGNLLEAEKQYRKCKVLLEQLAAELPGVPNYQVALAGCYCNLGNLVKNGGKPGESLPWFDKAIRILSAVYEKDHRLAVAKEYLRNSHWNRARAYESLKKYAEAISDWDKALDLSPLQEQPGIRAVRATARIQASQVAEAVAEVAELTKEESWSADQWYTFAWIYSRASGTSGETKQEYVERAMELLGKAVKAGYKDAAYMGRDPRLDPLRGRDDFKKLLANLEKKRPAKGEKQP